MVGYKQSVVQEYFGDGSPLGVAITYIEQEVQNGTGAALHLAKDFVAGEPFFFSFGDVITPSENYTGMVEYFGKHSCDALLGLNTVDDHSPPSPPYFYTLCLSCFSECENRYSIPFSLFR